MYITFWRLKVLFIKIFKIKLFILFTLFINYLNCRRVYLFSLKWWHFGKVQNQIFFIIFYSQYFWNLKITENMCDHNVEYWQLSINYIIFAIFFSILQVNAITFWDLTTCKSVISTYSYIYVKLRYIVAQEVPFL